MEEALLSLIASEILCPFLQTPDIAIALPEAGLKLYHPAEITVSFTNPLNRALTGGKFVLSGGGYVQDASVDVP